MSITDPAVLQRAEDLFTARCVESEPASARPNLSIADLYGALTGHGRPLKPTFGSMR